MLVTRVGMSFDWKGRGKGFFTKDCNILVKPGDTKVLPNIPFLIELETPLGTHQYWAGVAYKLQKEMGWELQSSEIKWCKIGRHILVRASPKRNFKVFVSHSNVREDRSLLKKIMSSFKSCGIKTYVAELTPRPGHPLWDKIHLAIRRADAILVLWTKYGSESGDVREEIGIAIGANKGKRIIPIVQKGLRTRGSLIGLEHISLDINNELEALSTAIPRAIQWADKKDKGKIKSFK